MLAIKEIFSWNLNFMRKKITISGVSFFFVTKKILEKWNGACEYENFSAWDAEFHLTNLFSKKGSSKQREKCEQHNRNQHEKAKAITQIPFETIRLVIGIGAPYYMGLH